MGNQRTTHFKRLSNVQMYNLRCQKSLTMFNVVNKCESHFTVTVKPPMLRFVDSILE